MGQESRRLMKAVTRNTLASAAMLSSATSISLITNNVDVGHAAVLRLRSHQTHKSEQQHFALNNNLPIPVQRKLKEGIMSISHSISMSHTISQSMCLRMSSDNGNIGNLSNTSASAVVDLDLTKKQVEIGIYLLDLYDLDLKSGSFIGDFYLWLRWKDDELDPTKFEFMNGEMVARDNPDRKKVGDLNYMSYRVRGKFRTSLDFRDYPLDKQLLVIQIEDTTLDANTLMYVADNANMAFSSSFHMYGWESADTPTYQSVMQTYETNYGEPLIASGEQSTYSRFVFYIPIKHAGADLIYFKTFIGVFISVAIAYLSFLIDPQDLDPRFGVGVAGIFGAVSSMIVVSSNMPENPYFTLSDKIHFVSLGFIFLSIFTSCVVLQISKKEGKTKLSKTINNWSGISLGLIYIGTVYVLEI